MNGKVYEWNRNKWHDRQSMIDTRDGCMNE